MVANHVPGVCAAKRFRGQFGECLDVVFRRARSRLPHIFERGIGTVRIGNAVQASFALRDIVLRVSHHEDEAKAAVGIPSEPETGIKRAQVHLQVIAPPLLLDLSLKGRVGAHGSFVGHGVLYQTAADIGSLAQTSPSARLSLRRICERTMRAIMRRSFSARRKAASTQTSTMASSSWRVMGCTSVRARSTACVPL